MILRLPSREIRFPRRPLLMGILNLNPDSFSNDGRVDPEWGLQRAKTLISEGADIIDVGAESARTNREPIKTEEEIERLEPFLDGWEKAIHSSLPRDTEQVFPPVLSINTWRPEVAAQIVPRGVELLNDMGGLPNDRNARICAAEGCSLLIMHTVGEPKQDHSHVRHPDLLAEMQNFFAERIERAVSAGMAKESLILDPGLGFAKQPEDDLRVCRELTRLLEFQRPLLLPVGRKGMIGHVLDLPEPKDRDAGTIAVMAFCAEQGASIFRIHNVGAAWLGLKILGDIWSGNRRRD